MFHKKKQNIESSPQKIIVNPKQYISTGGTSVGY